MSGSGRTRLLWLAVMLVLAWAMVMACPLTASAEVVVSRTGVVVDIHDKPIQDVVVTAYRWNGYIGQWEAVSTDLTERDGVFSVTVRTWYYGCTYYYLTFEHPHFVDARAPECDPDGNFYSSVYTELRCDECTVEPLTIVMVRGRQ